MTNVAELAARVTPRRLPFGFAKRYGVVVQKSVTTNTWCIVAKV